MGCARAPCVCAGERTKTETNYDAVGHAAREEGRGEPGARHQTMQQPRYLRITRSVASNVSTVRVRMLPGSPRP